MAELFDFGFTAVTEEELGTVQQTMANLESTDARLNELYNAIQPLLTNLRANPEKEYIYWPNRLEKVEAFSDMLDGIYRGS